MYFKHIEAIGDALLLTLLKRHVLAVVAISGSTKTKSKNSAPKSNSNSNSNGITTS